MLRRPLGKAWDVGQHPAPARARQAPVREVELDQDGPRALRQLPKRRFGPARRARAVLHREEPPEAGDGEAPPRYVDEAQA